MRIAVRSARATAHPAQLRPDLSASGVRHLRFGSPSMTFTYLASTIVLSASQLLPPGVSEPDPSVPAKWIDDPVSARARRNRVLRDARK